MKLFFCYRAGRNPFRTKIRPLCRWLLGMWLGAGAVAPVYAGTISGYVTDNTGTNFLANITVGAYRFFGSTWLLDNSQNTDTNGFYDLNLSLADNYVIRFSDVSGNYLTEYYDEQTGFLTASNIFVSISGVITGINASLSSASRVSGTVVGPDTVTPLPGINVVIAQFNGAAWEEIGSDTTDANGDYLISGLLAGTYRVKFYDVNGDYLTEYFDNSTSYDTADDVLVPLSTTLENIDATLALASSISGNVVDLDTFDPLENITVSAYQWNGSAWVFVAEGFTGLGGNYQITGLPAGTYRVEFMDGNSVYAVEYFDDVLEIGLAQDITLAAAEAETGIDAQLSSASSMTGKVTGPDDLPLSSVEVTAYIWNGANWDIANQTYPSGNGIYVLNGLMPGTYRVSFNETAAIYPIRFYIDAPDLLTADDIIIGGGMVVTGINMKLGVVVNNPPTNINLSGSSVLENQPAGTFVGTFTTEDEDVGNTFTYTLVSGAGDDDNGLFSIIADELNTAVGFNYETKSNLSIRVSSSDQDNASTEKAFTIAVGDINEIPDIQSLLPAPPNKLVIRWSSLTNQSFSIYESSNIYSGFSMMVTGLPATVPVNSYTITVSGAGNKAFRIQTLD
jgi:5-hydroxyisourate hydrolase-like protein (transthyretin family)